MAIPRQFQGLSLGARRGYATSAIQGTGVNPIHSIRDSQGGRNIAPDGSPITPAPGLVESDKGDGYGYTDEDQLSMWDGSQSATETGMADRPGLGQEYNWRAATTPGYPGYQPSPPSGTAIGESIRSQEHGAVAGNAVNETFFDGAAGWQNKQTGQVLEPGSGISDPDQYTRQTSIQQLRRTRAGSQRGNTNTEGQSPYDAPIETRVPGMKLKVYSGQFRFAQMLPRTARVAQRPFWNRRAGTGHVGWLAANSMYKSTPLDREAPPDPYQGPTVGANNGAQYGYTEEDQDWNY